MLVCLFCFDLYCFFYKFFLIVVVWLFILHDVSCVYVLHTIDLFLCLMQLFFDNWFTRFDFVQDAPHSVQLFMMAGRQ